MTRSGIVLPAIAGWKSVLTYHDMENEAKGSDGDFSGD
jgi:hypothetical protein